MPAPGPAPVVNGVALTPGTAVVVRVVSVSGPAVTPAPSNLAAPASAAPYAPAPMTGAPWVAPAVGQANPQAVISGTVLPGATATQTFVQTEAGTLAVAGRIAAPPGAQVGLEVLRAATPPAPATAAAALAPGGGPPIFSATAWPSLTEAMQMLDGSEAGRRLAALVPQADGRMVATIANYSAAVRAGGDLRQWPGGGITRALERAGERGERIAKALKGDLAEASTVRRDSAGTEWRVTTLPFQVGHEVHRIQMVSRRHPGDSEDGDGEGAGGGKGGGQRFLIALELSRLGPLQIDGLFKKSTGRFDLILRTHQPLPQDMRRDLTGLFANTVSAMGLKGGLGFQVTPQFETPLPDLAPHDARPGLFA